MKEVEAVVEEAVGEEVEDKERQGPGPGEEAEKEDGPEEGEKGSAHQFYAEAGGVVEGCVLDFAVAEPLGCGPERKGEEGGQRPEGEDPPAAAKRDGLGIYQGLDTLGQLFPESLILSGFGLPAMGFQESVYVDGFSVVEDAGAAIAEEVAVVDAGGNHHSGPLAGAAEGHARYALLDGEECALRPVPPFRKEAEGHAGGKCLVHFLKGSQACTATFHAPNPVTGHHQPTPSPETPRHPQASLLWGHCSFLLHPGAQKILFVPSQSLFPQSCVSSGGSILGLMATSSKGAYAIPRSTAPRAHVERVNS